MTDTPQIPASLGFKMPAEWFPHEATWLAWPVNPQIWAGRLAGVEEVYYRMLEHLLPGEKVFLLLKEEKKIEALYKTLQTRGISEKNLTVYGLTASDVWIRDYGPVFLWAEKTGRLAWCKWEFNAWGGKYEDYQNDNHLFGIHGGIIPYPCFRPGMILEGGSIEVNGRGTCIVTEQCLLNANRNPHLSKEQIEQTLKDYLGVKQVLWLGKGIAGDDTDGHVDDLVRFLNENTIAFAEETDPSDENYGVLKENHGRLLESRNIDEKPWELVPLPMPPKLECGGERKPASYANFYIANEVVLLPSFDCPEDNEAASRIKDFFPQKKIILVPSKDLIYGLGALHCVTQQQPQDLCLGTASKTET